MGVPGLIGALFSGVPSALSPKGTLGVDTVNQDAYVNLAGSAAWGQINAVSATLKGLQTVFIDSSPNRQWGYYAAGNGVAGNFAWREVRAAGSIAYSIGSGGVRFRFRAGSTSNGAEGTGEFPNSTGLPGPGFPHALMLNTAITVKFRYSSVANIRYYLFLCDTRMDTVVDFTDPAVGIGASYVGLRFSSDLSGNMFFVIGDGSTQLTEDTLIAGGTGNRFLRIFMNASGSITVQLLNNDGTVVDFEHTFSTNLMAASTPLSFQYGLRNLIGGAQPGTDLYSIAGTNRMNL